MIVGVCLIINQLMNKQMKILLILTLVTQHLSASDTTELNKTTREPYWGIDTQFINNSIKPGDDFYTHINAGWLKETSIPEGLSQLSSFNQLARQTRAQTEEIIQQALSSQKSSPIHANVANLLKSYTDVERRAQLGLQPIRQDIENIKSLTSKNQVARWMAKPRSAALVDTFIWLDAKDSSRHVLQMDQIKSRKILGMVNKSYYNQTQEPYSSYQKAYIQYIEQVLEKVGVKQARLKAQRVYTLEQHMASVMWEPAQIRDRKANYHPMTLDELTNYAPGFPWQAFLQARGLSKIDRLILGTDTAVQKTSALFAQLPLQDWKSYLLFHWVNNHRALLSDDIRQMSFDFYGKVLSGLQQPTSLTERGIRFVNRHLGHQVGQLYVKQHFSAQQKQHIEDLISYVHRAFKEKLTKQLWMDEQTRQKALQKLSNMQVKLGYPEVWRERAGLVIKADDLVGNYQRILEHNWQLERQNLNKPYPEGQWWMNPQTVDASFSPQLNRITFPAGILQPPFFDQTADAAVNFGAIGSIIGHEMGHGFDDQGSRFDANGVLNNWWSQESAQAFQQKADKLVEQYSGYSPLPNLSINGKQTLGENMADLIGVSIAYRAYQLYQADHEKSRNHTDDEYNGDQKFFMAWAQAHRTLWTNAALEKQLRNGHHTPGQYRVNAVVRNIEAWYKAFDIKPKDALYLSPDERIQLW